MKSSQSIWRYVVNIKSMVKILSILAAFLENMNFKPQVGTLTHNLWHANWQHYFLIFEIEE